MALFAATIAGTCQVCHHYCVARWYLRLPILFVAMILVDVFCFPFVHSFWNLVGFEGFFK